MCEHRILTSQTAIERLKESLNEVFERGDFPLEVKELYTQHELKLLVLSACRAGDFSMCEAFKEGRRIKVRWDTKALKRWIEEKLIPNTVVLTFDDEEVLKLLLFSMEFAFAMFEGKTKATYTQKGFRERSRDIETIVINTFVGSLGEVGLKRFLEGKFNISVKLDRSISTDIQSYRSDIVNARKLVSVKTTPNLNAVWAECPIGYDYGVFVKAVVPSAVILQAFAHVCGFRRLLDFSKESITTKEEETAKIIESLENRVFAQRCGTLKVSLKTFICGFFKPEHEGVFVKEGDNLPSIGKIREARYFIPISRLRFRREDWKEFTKDNF